MYTIYFMLYLIEILHQTTTHCKCIQFTLCCILSKFYIKPQLADRKTHYRRSCILSKFYIKPQQLREANGEFFVVSYRNSTSNHNPLLVKGCILKLYLIEILHQTTTLCRVFRRSVELYLIEILHQTTTVHAQAQRLRCCILSKFYIKPQHVRNNTYISPRCILSKFYIKPQLDDTL